MTETPTPDEIARWAHEHRQRDDGDECYGCWCDAVVETWPCPIARLLALVAAQAEQNAELRGDCDRMAMIVETNRHIRKRAEAELSALRATDEYQRWARVVAERDAARDAVARVRIVIDEMAAKREYSALLFAWAQELRDALDGGAAT